MSDRKSFQHLPGDENPQFLEDGKRIYLEMRRKYPHQTIGDLDNILNGLCAALICLISDNVMKDDHKNFLQLVHRILSKNI
jgi:hypothetical protein